MDDFLKSLKTQDSLRMLVLTGSGVSAESGIKTFRDNDGLWENYRMEDVATPLAFEKSPDLVYRFYNERRRQLLTCEPNAAHISLASLENLPGIFYNLITQNVDDLHERGGSKKVIHMHGELLKVRCIECEEVFRHEEDIDGASKCEKCNGRLRPHIVWFYEIPFFMNEIEALVMDCNLFVSIGTSGIVYPAAGLSQVAVENGAFAIEIIKERTGGVFNFCLEGPATEKVEEMVNVLKDHNHLWK